MPIEIGEAFSLGWRFMRGVWGSRGRPCLKIELRMHLLSKLEQATLICTRDRFRCRGSRADCAARAVAVGGWS
jgi:hypothetical protein